MTSVLVQFTPTVGGVLFLDEHGGTEPMQSGCWVGDVPFEDLTTTECINAKLQSNERA